MRVPLSWLRDFVDPGIAVDVLAERLTLSGTKVEAVHHHGVDSLDAFVVGKVLSAERHPDADRLTVCVVDRGEPEPAQIVCGAPNVAAGQTVAVAKPGAVMPDGTRLKRAKLRGVESDGMILAEDELGIGTDHWGILVLDDKLQAGAPLADVLPIATEVLELEITPNRPDCLGIYGVAREVHATLDVPLAAPPWAEDPGTRGAVAGVEVTVECADLCPRFTARAFEDVTIGASPEWLKARLMAAGQRPINNVVDITNYVMLVAGQPLHAFDLDRVAGRRLVVRRARDGERVETLDGIVRELDGEMVVIDDAEGPTSIAGVMGGARSEVHGGTTRVLMEVATWIGHNIQRTSTRLGLRSEASGRFEKQLQPEQAVEALALATSLMLELTGARLVGGTIDVGGPGPEPVTLRLRDAKVAGLLGRAIPRERSADYLGRLGFALAEAADGLDVRVPHWRRRDVYREADLVEEVARLDGLDALPATLPSRRGAIGVLTTDQRLRRRAQDALVAAGLHEIVGWSFVAPDHAARLGIETDPLRILNPMSEDQSVMRLTLLTSLLDAARRNVTRGAADLALWEMGPVYLPDRAPAYRDWSPPEGSEGQRAAAERRLPHEAARVAVLLTGRVRPATWREAEPPAADFFAAKGVLEALLRALRVNGAEVTVTTNGTSARFLHPGRAARVMLGGEDAGWLGELHPSVAAQWDLDGAAGFEIDLGALLDSATSVPRYEDLTSFPAVRQDLAVLAPDALPADEIVRVVRDAGGSLLRRADIFDVYRGEQVGEGRRSLALRLEFRAPDRTLSDEDVAPRRARIITALSKLGAEPRA